ncbi:hypothetical protein, partial [Methanoculleus sp. UBA291]|uniref:hypothetical protein n=1 Tax=Methanoculleus sp. UBA291 TaxID=1915495 RepID=UPI00316ABEF1
TSSRSVPAFEGLQKRTDQEVPPVHRDDDPTLCPWVMEEVANPHPAVLELLSFRFLVSSNPNS